MRPASSKVIALIFDQLDTLAPSGTGTADAASYSVLGSTEKCGAAQGSTVGLVVALAGALADGPAAGCANDRGNGGRYEHEQKTSQRKTHRRIGHGTPGSMECATPR